MTCFAIWNPDSLLGREIKESLARRRDLWDDLRLLAPESEDEAVVTNIGDEAAFVLPPTGDSLDDIDVLFACEFEDGSYHRLEGLDEKATTIVIPSNGCVDGIPALVAGVNAGPIAAGSTVASAHPAVVALAHVLSPLDGLGFSGCTATVLLPSSTFDQQGIDELLAQTRAILAFQEQPHGELFDHQLAFNIVPGEVAGNVLARSLAEVLEFDPTSVAIQTGLSGVFHGLTISALIHLDPECAAASVRSKLAASDSIEMAAEARPLGPVAAAGKDKILLGAIEPASAPGSFWLWAVTDNLTAGGALNAIGIAEACSSSSPAGYAM